MSPSLESSAQALLISQITFPVSFRVNNYLKRLILKSATSLESSAQALLISAVTQKLEKEKFYVDTFKV